MSQEKGNKSILLFTAAFPYGSGEQFLETELLYLSNAFEQVIIIPSKTDGVHRRMPGNCKVIVGGGNFVPEKKIRHYIFRNIFIIIKVLAYTIWHSKERKRYLKTLKKWIVQIALEAEKSKRYNDFLGPYLKETNILYFYWFLNPFFNFCLLKEQKKIGHRLVSRAHGYDIDEQQGRFPLFREFELKHVNTLLPVSEYGYNYLSKRYMISQNIMHVSYLGTLSLDSSSQFVQSSAFHIVSCSSLIPLKRVHLIIEILRNLKFPLKWTHIGTGELFDTIKEKSEHLPSTIEIDLKGYISNEAVLNFYRTNAVNLFINTSSMEGIPVSIMEAMSFGIPAVGCNICGIPEIVTDESGFLIPVDFDPAEVAQKITEYYHLPEDKKHMLHAQTRSFWNANFNAEKNYPLAIEKYLIN